MDKKQSLLVTLKAKHRKKSKKRIKDLCIVCNKNLYYNADFSRRIGLIDEDSTILGWMCPFCHSEFTEDDKLITLNFDCDGISGEA